MARKWFRSKRVRDREEEARRWQAEQEGRRAALFAKGSGVIVVCIEENLEERLAIPVSRVRCETAVLDRLLEDLASVVGHGPRCHFVSYVEMERWPTFGA